MLFAIHANSALPFTTFLDTSTKHYSSILSHYQIQLYIQRTILMTSNLLEALKSFLILLCPFIYK